MPLEHQGTWGATLHQSGAPGTQVAPRGHELIEQTTTASGKGRMAATPALTNYEAERRRAFHEGGWLCTRTGSVSNEDPSDGSVVDLTRNRRCHCQSAPANLIAQAARRRPMIAGCMIGTAGMSAASAMGCSPLRGRARGQTRRPCPHRCLTPPRVTTSHPNHGARNGNAQLAI